LLKLIIRVGYVQDPVIPEVTVSDVK